MGMQSFPASEGSRIALDLVGTITENRVYLSEIDGAIADGDHGINMAKGFGLCREGLNREQLSLARAFQLIGDTLMSNIGGSMGPLYGIYFTGMGEAVEGLERIDADAFARMLQEGLDNIVTVSDAKVGDKTLLDTMVPAVHAFRDAVESGQTFAAALDRMTSAAENGRDSTRDMTAKVGRASRLGERSRGVLDAGAVSSCLLLVRMARSISPVLT